MQDETVRHIETTLARSLFNCDELQEAFLLDPLICSDFPPELHTPVLHWRSATDSS